MTLPDVVQAAGTAGARRRISWRLFRHILREYLSILGITLLGFLTLFLVSAMYDDLGDFTSKGVPLRVVGEYFLLLQPDALIAVIPMSLLLATMYTVATANKNNELTAIRASGVSIPLAFLPLLLTGICFSVILFGLSEVVAPESRMRAMHLHTTMTDYSGSDYVEEVRDANLAYRNREARRDWLFGDFSSTGISNDVVVTQFREDGTVMEEIRARRAQYLPQTGSWRFEDGVRTLYSELGNELAEPPRRFDSHAAESWREDPQSIGFALSIRPAAAMSLFEIMRVMRQASDELSSGTRQVMRTHQYFRLTFPLSCVVAVLLGVPLAISRQRAATMRSIVLGVMVMALFYVTAQLFMVLGNLGVLPPLIAGCLPTLFFIAWGLREMKRKM